MLRKIADGLKDWTGPAASRGLGVATVSAIALLIWSQVSQDRPMEPAAPVPPVAGHPAHDRSIAAAEASAATHGEMHNVTIFQTITLTTNGRVVYIVSGALYATSNSLSPESQYCYLKVGYQTAASELVLTLARKQGSRPPSRVNLTTEDAVVVNLSLTFVTQMVDRCRWV